MLDLSALRDEPERYRRALSDRGASLDLDALLARDADRRQLIQELEGLQAERNSSSKKIGELKRAGEDASEAMERVRAIGDRIKELDESRRAIDEELQAELLGTPNVAHASVPVGADESDNREERRHGEPADFDFEPRDHVDLAEGLGLLDLERAAKISGARFSVQYGDGARLERALAAYMLDTHTDHGYLEVVTPYLVSADSMVGSGQLPKFAEDAFLAERDGLYLIPTSEVPLVNLHREETLEADRLPLKYTAFTPCFRREAGSYGRDTRGLIRVHQFQKVELVWFAEPDDSWDALEMLTRDAERILQGLELPYRVVTLSTGDMGFAAAKTYDLEVWLPSQGRYREISSCSNCTDFQARRAAIRCRPAGGGKSHFVHTLNGSGVAVGRALVALLENHQQSDGSVRIPSALRPYMGGRERLEPAPGSLG